MGLSRIATWFKRPSRFRTRHFRRREDMRPDYQAVAHSLLSLVDFESVADIGCANGFLLEEFHLQGRTIAGIEVSPDVVDVLDAAIKPFVSIGDFSAIEGRYDLVCCVEVAEHIAPKRSQDLVDTLVGAADRWIYFTAAPPGQSGHGHINCRPHAEWLEMFADHDWVRDPERTATLRSDLSALGRATWLEGNSFLLRPATRDEEE